MPSQHFCEKKLKLVSDQGSNKTCQLSLFNTSVIYIAEQCMLMNISNRDNFDQILNQLFENICLFFKTIHIQVYDKSLLSDFLGSDPVRQGWTIMVFLHKKYNTNTNTRELVLQYNTIPILMQRVVCPSLQNYINYNS